MLLRAISGLLLLAAVSCSLLSLEQRGNVRRSSEVLLLSLNFSETEFSRLDPFCLFLAYACLIAATLI